MISTVPPTVPSVHPPPSSPDLRTICILILILVSNPQLSAQPKLHRVPQDFRTIQSAVNASLPGDTVLVDQGVYYENVRIVKNIVLASRFILDGDAAHIRQTVLDGSRPLDSRRGSVITITGPTDTSCQVVGFSIRNGTGTSLYLVPLSDYSPVTQGGGGVLVINAGARIAHNCIVNNRLTASSVADIALGGGILTVDTTFSDEDPPYIIIEDNIVTGNEIAGMATRSGGVEISQPGIVRHNVITYNKALARTRSGGGGLSIQSSVEFTVHVVGNYIAHNVAGHGGGIFIANDHRPKGRGVLTNNIIASNEALELGGGVSLVEMTKAILIHNTIVGNRSPTRAGGISAPHNTVLVMVNNILWVNETEQLTTSEHARTLNNLVEGEDIGLRTIGDDPLFVPGDSLYRLSPGSPCIGTGVAAFQLAGLPFPLPADDYAGIRRIYTNHGRPDIGAMESPEALSPAGRRILDAWTDETDRTVALTVAVRQVSQPVMSPDGMQLEKAAELATDVIINDSDVRPFSGPATDITLTLPPEDNLIEVDLTVRGRDRSRRLWASVWLQPVEQRSNRLSPTQDYIFCRYRNLMPGTYELMIRPHDEAEFIDVANQSSIRIEVLPYWYNRWWAYLLYALAVAGVFFSLYRYRMRSVALEQKLLTEHLQAEKLEEMDRMKSRFFANVTHELRTPLTLILGPVDSLLGRTQSASSLEQLGFIQRNAQKLLRAVDMLLDLSRLESGTVTLRVAEQDAVALLRKMTGYYASPAAKKQIDLRFEAREEFVAGFLDAEKLEHILQNLISNALKFCKAGDTIEVSVWRETDHLLFSVRDTGPGISAEDLPRIFDRFYRADETHKTEGTGIGLALTKEFVELHHGSIDVQSRRGGGTTFTVRIPLAGYAPSEIIESPPMLTGKPEHPQAAVVPEEEGLVAGASGGKPVVLVAEDNDDARQFIASQLADQYEVIKAVDGLEAINTTQYQIPDLIISDVMMPNKDGYEVCKAIKTDERTCHIPVILLTALAEQDQKLSGLEHGADDYLAKPFDVKELKVRVRNLIENRKKVRESFMRTTELRPGSIHVSSLDDTFLQKAIGVVEKHMSEAEFDVEQFARDMFLSRRQLNRKLTAITNLPATDFVRHVRLQRAKDLLEQNAGTVAEIADSVGFANHSYFAKTFQEKFGLLPSQVRTPE